MIKPRAQIMRPIDATIVPDADVRKTWPATLESTTPVSQSVVALPPRASISLPDAERFSEPDYWASNLVKPLATRARISPSPAVVSVDASGSFTAQA